MANWGIGIGAFSDGIVKGIGLGNAVKETRNQAEIEKLTKGGMEQAKLAREQAVNGAVQQVDQMVPGKTDLNGGGVLANPAAAGIETKANPVPSPLDGLATTPGDVMGLPKEVAPLKATKETSYNIGERKFATKDEATKAADADTPPIMEYFMREGAPKIRDAYIAQGNIEKAERFDKWIGDSTTKAGMRYWSQATTAMQMGDFDRAADRFVKGLNSGYMESHGYTASGHELVKDDQGNVTAFRLTLKGKDGKEIQQEFANTEDVRAAMAGMGDPMARFEAASKEALEAKKAKLEQKAELAKEDRQHSRKLQEIKYTKETDGQLSLLRSNLRKSEETHKAQFKTGPGGTGKEYRPSRSPEDLAGDFRQLLMKDYSFKKLSHAEQDAEVWRQVQSIYPGAKPGQPRNVAQEQGAGDAGGIPVVTFED